MPNITLSIPDDVHRFIKAHRDVRWSEIVREAIVQRIEREEMIEEIERLAKKSMLTPEDARKIGDKIKEGMRRRIMDEIGGRHERHHKRDTQ